MSNGSDFLVGIIIGLFLGIFAYLLISVNATEKVSVHKLSVQIERAVEICANHQGIDYYEFSKFDTSISHVTCRDDFYDNVVISPETLTK